jgi:uncharacterized protein (DUF433 family)
MREHKTRDKPDLELLTMDWRGRIVATPDTLFGRPRVAGTRIGVDLVLELLASGWTEGQILEEYPQLRPEDLQAVLAFVRDCLEDEVFILHARAGERSGHS